MPSGHKIPLSVVLPAYNSGDTIVRAVRSILDSPGADFELIVVNDGSTDQTVERVQAIPDPRLQLLHQDHRGPATAFAHGLRHARGRWIARMDADDIATPDRLVKQLEHLHSTDGDAVGGLVQILDATGRPVPTMNRYEQWLNSLITPEAIAAYRFVESPLVNPTAMARREIFEMGYRAGPWPEDYDLWLRVLHAGFRISKIPEPLLTWTDHPQRLTRSDPRYSAEAFDRCRRMHLLEGPLRGVERVHLWGAGKTGKPWMRWLLAEGFTVKTLTDVSPRKLGQNIHGVIASDPEALPSAGTIPLIIAVGASGARNHIARFITARGFVPGENAWFVA
jgi:glycosyltransferase involved in cell wall biosynthesis